MFDTTIDDSRGEVVLELPWSGWIADDGPEPAIARGLTAMIMDHVLGFAISLGRPNFPPSTTIDLRIDWSRPLIAGAPARVNVDGLFGEGDVILAVGSLWQNMGDSPCAIGTGRFLSGVYPGRQSARADSEIPAPLAMPEGPASFSRFLGLESLSGGRFILPGVPRLAGQAHVGAFHGGVIAAASERAAQVILSDWSQSGQARCVTLEIEYMRPAFTAADILLTAEVLRVGRSTACVEIETRQNGWDGPVLTRATTMWVKEAEPQ
ncbi:MAG: acyl-CoA thioesterase domain-containing protein [Novosphingobium sp.]